MQTQNGYVQSVGSFALPGDMVAYENSEKDFKREVGQVIDPAIVPTMGQKIQASVPYDESKHVYVKTMDGKLILKRRDKLGMLKRNISLPPLSKPANVNLAMPTGIAAPRKRA